MKKNKFKTKLKHTKKRLFAFKFKHFFHNIKSLQIGIQFLSRYKKHILIVFGVILLICVIWVLSQLWLIQTSFSESKTYSKVSVLGVNVGNLDKDGLKVKLTKIKSEFETKKITLKNGKDQWVYDFSKLGVSFDTKSTDQAIWHFNNLDIIDKYKVITSAINPNIEPVITYDSKKCIESLSAVTILQINPQDASIYFDKELKIKPDESGKKFNAALTCQEISKQLASNKFIINVAFDFIAANITKSNLEPKISQIQSIISKSVTLKSGSYQLDLASKQLFDLLEISKKESGVQIDWSSAKLDELINSIEAQVNTYNNGPALGACQYLASSGGNRLDKAATKKIFTDLNTDSSRTYNLSVNNVAPVVGNRKQIPHGNSGTVYLTFDDGFTYADQIMNYAACYGVKVTFFELGSRVGTDAAGIRRAIAEGHSVQAHGYEHAMYDYGNRSYDWQYNDISQSINAITSVTGIRPTYFRPPGGNRSSATYSAASANGVTLILWGVTSADSGGLTSAVTCNNVVSRAFSGASVLMHSTRLSTAEAVPCIIEGLAARGFNMSALR